MDYAGKRASGRLARGSRSNKKNKKRMRRSTLIAYLFMAPALLVLLVFVVYPIAFSLPLGLFKYTGMTAPQFIGLDNFSKALHDKNFWIALKNSATFVITVPILQLLSIGLAVIVNQKMRGITVFRVLYYLPVVTSMIAVSIIWKFLFDPDGIINLFLLSRQLISRPIYFLLDEKLAMPSLMFVSVWQGLGYYMMLYLAGLQSVPAGLLEAAHIDGATAFKAFFKITIPMLKPYIWVCSLFNILGALGVFDVVFAMTKGGPNKATLVMNYYTYTNAFQQFKYGYAAAIGLMMSLVTTSFSLLIFVYGKRGGMTHGE